MIQDYVDLIVKEIKEKEQEASDDKAEIINNYEQVDKDTK